MDLSRPHRRLPAWRLPRWTMPLVFVLALLFLLVFRGQAAFSYGLVNAAQLAQPTTTRQDLLREAYAVDPSNERAVWNLGLSLYKPEDPARAVAVWRQAPDLAALLSLRGAAADKSDAHAALAWFSAAVQVAPDSSDGYDWVAQTQKELGNDAAARDAYAAALKLDANNPQRYVDYARLLIDENYDLPLAASLLQQAGTLQPGSEELYRALSDLAAANGDRAGQMHWLELAVRADPNPSAANLLNLAADYMAVGRYSDAIAIYQQTVAAEPKSSSAHLALAQAYLQTGQWADAVAEAQAALTRNPNWAAAWVVLARAQSGSGNTAAARAAVEKALALDPNNQDARSLLQALKAGTTPPGQVAGG